jgi:hypothetical protein
LIGGGPVTAVVLAVRSQLSLLSVSTSSKSTGMLFMRCLFILAAWLLLSVASKPFVAAQDDLGDGPRAVDGGASTLTSRPYLIEVIEFQIDASDGADLSPDQLVQTYLQMKDDGLLRRVEKARFFATLQKASHVNFGKQIALTTGSTSAEPGRPVARQVRQFETGTTVEAMVDSVSDGQVSMQIVYRSTRLEGNETADSLPEIQSISMEATLVMELGKTQLLGGTSADPNVYVLITVSE